MTEEEEIKIIERYRNNAKEVVKGLFSVESSERRLAREGSEKMRTEILKRNNNRKYFCSQLKRASSLSEIDIILRDARYAS